LSNSAGVTARVTTGATGAGMANGMTISGGTILLAGLLAAPAWSAEFEQTVPFTDLYLSYGVTRSPTVEERTDTPAGAGTTYDWKHQKDNVGQRAAVGAQSGVGHDWGGIVWGGELAGTQHDITPELYLVSGAELPNTSGATLRYRTAGLTLFAGYEFGVTGEQDEISAFLTITPVVGGGGAWADNELHYANGTYERRRGSGWYVEYGVRVGFFITEQRWMLGLNAEYLAGTGKVSMDFPGGYSSELTLDRDGFGGNLIAGYRF
jgi:hypothetical protein